MDTSVEQIVEALRESLLENERLRRTNGSPRRRTSPWRSSP
ncbi:polyketide synthase docking domain-containing protein [Streptomyces nogalater]